MAVTTCADQLGVLKSLRHCDGKPSYSGVRRKMYLVRKVDVATFPTLPDVAKGDSTKAATYVGSFALAMDKKWVSVDLTDAAKVTSKAAGEYPEKYIENEGEFPYAENNPEVAGFISSILNGSVIGVFQDFDDRWRVIGNEKWRTEVDAESTTGDVKSGGVGAILKLKARDVAPCPYYVGTLDTEEGEIQCAKQVPSPEAP